MRNSSKHSIFLIQSPTADEVRNNCLTQIEDHDDSFTISTEHEIEYAKKALAYHGLHVSDQF
jgi:hypothetical protein